MIFWLHIMNDNSDACAGWRDGKLSRGMGENNKKTKMREILQKKKTMLCKGVRERVT